MKFREHRGGLAESMITMVEVPDVPSLIAHIRQLLSRYVFEFPDDAVHIRLYLDTVDKRIGWKKTYIVTIDKYGVIGWTDSKK
jgi:hypothetical protein